MTEVPGKLVTSATITPECVVNRTENGAWTEACTRLWQHYTQIIDGWKDAPQQPTLTLTLTMERPGASE